MIRSILLGLGGTSFTEVAIEMGIGLAQQHQAHLTGVTVVNPQTCNNVGPVPVGGGAYAQRMRNRCRLDTAAGVREVIATFETRCKDAGITAHTEQEQGDPFSLMAQHARFNDLTIFGLRSLFDYALTAEPKAALIQLLSHGVRPIIAVAEQSRPIRKAMIAFCGQMSSAKAMRRFVQLNPWPSTKLEILHCARTSSAQIQADLEAAANYCRLHGFEVEVSVKDADPRKDLVELAQASEADLIVMGNGMRRLLVRKMIGDTVLNTILNADRPLFLTQ